MVIKEIYCLAPFQRDTHLLREMKINKFRLRITDLVFRSHFFFFFFIVALRSLTQHPAHLNTIISFYYDKRWHIQQAFKIKM